MEKTITFNIPKGYVIDKENSTDTNIVLKLTESSRPKTWEEYCEKIEGKNSYYLDESNYNYISSQFGHMPIMSEFDSKEDTKAFVAFIKLLKLRKSWIGDWKPNWNINNNKYVIICSSNNPYKDTLRFSRHTLSFPTKEMRDEFFDCFKNYIEQAKTLL